MAEQEIRDEAPSGATHYYHFGDMSEFHASYYMCKDGLWFFWNLTKWSATYRDILSFAKPL